MYLAWLTDDLGIDSILVLYKLLVSKSSFSLFLWSRGELKCARPDMLVGGIGIKQRTQRLAAAIIVRITSAFC